MRKDNTQNYQTPYTKIQHFRDFNNEIGQERDELNKTKRSYQDNENDVYDLPNKYKYKYNKVTHKYDDNTEEEIDGRLDEIEKEKDKVYKFSNDEVNPNHFYKNDTDVKESKVKTFEAFMSGPIHDQSIPKLNRTLDIDMNNDDYCDCCLDCVNKPGCNCCEDCKF